MGLYFSARAVRSKYRLRKKTLISAQTSWGVSFLYGVSQLRILRLHPWLLSENPRIWLKSWDLGHSSVGLGTLSVGIATSSVESWIFPWNWAFVRGFNPFIRGFGVLYEGLCICSLFGTPSVPHGLPNVGVYRESWVTRFTYEWWEYMWCIFGIWNLMKIYIIIICA